MGSAHTDGDALTIYECPNGHVSHSYVSTGDVNQACQQCGLGVQGPVRVFREEDVRPLWDFVYTTSRTISGPRGHFARETADNFPAPDDWKD